MEQVFSGGMPAGVRMPTAPTNTLAGWKYCRPVVFFNGAALEPINRVGSIGRLRFDPIGMTDLRRCLPYLLHRQPQNHEDFTRQFLHHNYGCAKNLRIPAV